MILRGGGTGIPRHPSFPFDFAENNRPLPHNHNCEEKLKKLYRFGKYQQFGCPILATSQVFVARMG
jgi:hypothetical protein